jgi:Tetratricopeptide repeat
VYQFGIVTLKAHLLSCRHNREQIVVYRVQFYNVIVRVAFFALVLGLVTALGRICSHHFILRTLADERLLYRRNVLLPAVEQFPSSPRLQKRVIESYLNPDGSESEEDGADYAKAAEHAMQAVRLSPRHGRYWYWLAQAQEGQGLNAEAEQSLWQAAKLAPADSQVNWGLANVLVRAGKVDESVEYFRRAVSLNSTLYPQAFDTLWQAGGRKLELLQAICGNKPAAQVGLAQYLVEQKLYAECAAMFASLAQTTDIATLAVIPQTNDLLYQLLVAEQPLVARQLWSKLQPASANQELLWDGGFEDDGRPAFPQFTWALRDSDFARVGYDNSVHRSGESALKLLFTGRDSTVLGGEVRQRLALEPGRRYRFEASVKGDKLINTGGPQLAIVAYNGVAVAQSEPLPSGTWDWQTVSFEFVAPVSGKAVFFDIVRSFKLAYDPPTKGSLWFDDLKLVALEN